MSVTISTHNGSAVAREHNIRNPKVVSKELHIQPDGKFEIWHDEKPQAAYQRIFGQALEEYNNKQKRADRKIQDYYRHICNDKKKHPVYEMIVTIGNRNNTVNEETGYSVLQTADFLLCSNADNIISTVNCLLNSKNNLTFLCQVILTISFCSKIIFDEIQVDWRNKADFVKNGDGIMSEEIRDKKITIRVSQREKENIEKKAEQAKMSMSKYLLAAAENKKIRVTQNIPHLYLEITRIGVNINQIAHVANSQKYINTQQIHEVKNLLREVEKDMKKVVDSLKDEEETSYENLEKIVLTMEKRMSAMESRMSKLEMNFDQAFYFMGEKLDRLLEEKDKK